MPQNDPNTPAVRHWKTSAEEHLHGTNLGPCPRFEHACNLVGMIKQCSHLHRWSKKNQTAFSFWNYSAIRSKRDWIYSLVMKANVVVPLDISRPHDWKTTIFWGLASFASNNVTLDSWKRNMRNSALKAARLGISGFRRSVLCACKYHKFISINQIFHRSSGIIISAYIVVKLMHQNLGKRIEIMATLLTQPWSPDLKLVTFGTGFLHWGWVGGQGLIIHVQGSDMDLCTYCHERVIHGHRMCYSLRLSSLPVVD